MYWWWKIKWWKIKHCQTLPDPARPCKHPHLVILSLSLSLSLPRRLGPIKAGLTCLLSLSRQRHSSYTVPPGSCRGWTPAAYISRRKTRGADDSSNRGHTSRAAEITCHWKQQDESVISEETWFCMFPALLDTPHTNTKGSTEIATL